MKVIRNAVAILLFVVAGFSALEAQFTAFVNLGHPGVTFAMIGGFFVFAAVVLAAGAFAGTFRPRMRAAGTVLIVSAAFAAFSAFTMGTLMLSPRMMEILQQNGAGVSASMFRVVPGVIATAVTALVGVGLLRLSRARA